MISKNTVIFVNNGKAKSSDIEKLINEFKRQLV